MIEYWMLSYLQSVCVYIDRKFKMADISLRSAARLKENNKIVPRMTLN
jgi:hypothetical protein